MTKQELWKHFIKNNPNWESDGANLTAKGLQKLVNACYAEGAKQQRKLSQKSDDEWKNGMKGNPEISDLFGDILSGKKK